MQFADVLVPFVPGFLFARVAAVVDLLAARAEAEFDADGAAAGRAELVHTFF